MKNEGGALKILICEDDVVTSRLMRQQLEAEGYRVVALCGSGEEAVKLSAFLEPDLLLMDIALSGEMDGLAASDMIMRQLNIPIVFITGNDDRHIKEKALELNPLGYLYKPLSTKAFKSLVQGMMESVNRETRD